MANLVPLSCETCGSTFSVRPYRAIPGPRLARFCSGSCRAKWVSSLPHVQARNRAPKPAMLGNTLRKGLKPGHAFPKGHVPWNRDMKGIHLSPASEFKKGNPSRSKVPVGTERVRKDKRTGTRVFVKVAEPNAWKLRAVKVWEDANGPVPKGMLIHHHDHDKMHDDLSNLRCITRAQHAEEHRAEIYAGRWPK